METPRWTQWLAGTLGGIVGSAVGNTILSLLSYPIFSNQKGANNPGPSALYFGFSAGYPLGSALGSGFGVEKSRELLGQKTHGLRTYFTSGITAGSMFYGSFVLGRGLKILTDQNEDFGFSIQLPGKLGESISRRRGRTPN